jgi:hypothetical protein
MEELGCDRLASSDFLQLLGPKPTATGLTDGGTHNAFLILADPSDTLASLVLTIASGTQVLNYATGVLMGATGFLPNLYPGTVAACLMKLLSQDRLSEFQRQQARQMVHALRCLHRNPAPRALNGGTAANPEDNISKLIAALISLEKRVSQGQKAASVATPDAATAATPLLEQQTLQAEKSTVDMEICPADDLEQGPSAAPTAVQMGLRLVSEEWLASLVQRYYGKRTPETNSTYLKSITEYFPLEVLLAKSAHVDPLQQLHPLELHSPGEGGGFVGQWEQQVLARLKGGVPGVVAHPALVQFQQGAKRLLELLHRDGQEPGMQAVADVWPGWESQGLLPALLLRQRTARYSSTLEADAAEGEEGRAELVWERADVGTNEELAWGRLREALGEQLEGFRRVREAAAEGKLVAAVAASLLSNAGDEVGAGAALPDLFLDLSPETAQKSKRPANAPKGPFARLLNVDVSLGRSAVPAIIEKLGEPQLTPVLLRVLVVGEWTTAPPQALRRAHRVRELCQLASGGDELLKMILAIQQCARIPTAEAGANRHGHNVDRQYPGPDGWTREYEEARMKAIAGKNAQKVMRYLFQMRKFTKMADAARRVAAGLDASKQRDVERVLALYRDANNVSDAQNRVEAVLGQALSH